MTRTSEAGERIKRKADEEAARAEAENPEEEPANPDAEPTPEEEEEAATEEQEAPAEQQGDEPSPEQVQAQFDMAVNDFKATLCEVFGVEELQTSETPGVVGFVMPGFTEKKPHPNFKRCDTCNGHGTVLTGSTREGFKEQDCPDQRCSGRGYWQKNQQTQQQQPQTLVPLPSAQNGEGEFGPAPTWMGDPNLTAPPPAFTPPTP